LTTARKRIKARFSATPEPIQLFFPSKWQINQQLPVEPVFARWDVPPKDALQVSLF
jgi:hypothetical protein